MYFWYWSLILLVPALILGIYAQAKVSSSFNRYSQVPSARGLTGAQAARLVLDSAGLSDVGIEVAGSRLSDHYDPRSRTLTLSPEVGNSNSLAALGVAAHEAGHAMQHADGYVPFKFRSALVPVANIGTNFGFILFFVGLVFFRSGLLMNIGIVLYAAAVLFTLVTLPVEFNASRRAMAQLSDRSILVADELTGAKKVLSAAALTYVAAASDGDPAAGAAHPHQSQVVARGRRGGAHVRTAGPAGPHAPHGSGQRGGGGGGRDRHRPGTAGPLPPPWPLEPGLVVGSLGGRGLSRPRPLRRGGPPRPVRRGHPGRPSLPALVERRCARSEGRGRLAARRRGPPLGLSGGRGHGLSGLGHRYPGAGDRSQVSPRRPQPGRSGAVGGRRSRPPRAAAAGARRGGRTRCGLPFRGRRARLGCDAARGVGAAAGDDAPGSGLSPGRHQRSGGPRRSARVPVFAELADRPGGRTARWSWSRAGRASRPGAATPSRCCARPGPRSAASTWWRTTRCRRRPPVWSWPAPSGRRTCRTSP